MRGDNLKTHMMRRDHLMGNNEGTGRNAVNVATNEEQINCTSGSVGKLEKRVIDINKEFNRKIEFGQNLKSIVDKNG